MFGYSYLDTIPISYYNLCNGCESECNKAGFMFWVHRNDHEEDVKEFMYRIVIYDLNKCLCSPRKDPIFGVDLSNGLIYDETILESELENRLSELLLYRISELAKNKEDGE